MFGLSRRILACGVLLTAMFALAGCGGGLTRPEKEPPLVQVAPVIEAPLTDYLDFIGRTDSSHPVVLKARATGYLQEVNFKDGDFVKKGQLLYVIDEAPYKA